ncbi:MAG: hypothetical protein JW774_11125 [Candidatus Aureabacteria bacterium]|nr:hypothetical protein [Candidatus Auribacterota bacterium]
MKWENRIFSFCLLLALGLHAFGMMIISIRTPVVQELSITEVSLLQDFQERIAPKAFTTDKPIAAPSFISLPESNAGFKEKMFFHVNQIRGFAPVEGDEYFKEAEKMIAEEAYYFEPELNAERFLPLEENQIALYRPFPLTEDKSEMKIPFRYRMEYQGRNKTEIEDKFAFLRNKIIKLKASSSSPLVILVSFSDKNEILHCQIDQSSGDSAFDQKILRSFQSTILPLKNRKISFRGRFIIHSMEENE